MAKLVSAFACSHAPQIIKAPTITDEYVKQVQSVQNGIVDIGKKIKENQTNLLILIGADHLESFFFDNYPMILLPICGKTKGEFAGEQYEYSVDSHSSITMLKRLVNLGFDISFSQSFKLDHPFRSPLKWIEKEYLPKIIPIHINSNISPVISKQRAYEFGRAIRKIIEEDLPDELKVTVIGTGGLSHFPGTPEYGKVDTDFDKRLLKLITEGKGKEVLKFSDEELQNSGNLEIRTWIAAMAVSCSDKGVVKLMVPTFHIDYSIVEFEIANYSDDVTIR